MQDRINRCSDELARTALHESGPIAADRREAAGAAGVSMNVAKRRSMTRTLSR